MKDGRRKGGAAIPAALDTGRRHRSNMAQPVYKSTTGIIKGGAAQNIVEITSDDLVQNGGQYKLMGGAPVPMEMVTGRRRKQGATQVVYPVDINGNYDWTFTSVYLLRDEFTTALAAGSVNGTLAEPGPGTRNVVDTGNVLPIAGGLATCAAPTGLADPLLTYDEIIVRVAGRVGLFLNSIATTQTYSGFDDGQIAVPLTNSFYRNTAQLLIYDAGVNRAVGAIVGGASYDFAVVLRAAGSFYFIRGGAFTDWTLVWVGAVDNTANLYFSHGWRNGAASIDTMRIPDSLWLPAPLLSDSFDRANGALGNTDGAGHAEANGGGGAAWNNRVGTTQIAANTASASALVGGIAIATVDGGNADVLHEAELTRVGGNVGIVMRYADAANYVYAIHTGANAQLIKRVAGAETPVVDVVTAYAAGAVCSVICDGTSFRLFYNNLAIGNVNIADASLQNGTEHGLYSSNVGNSQDDMVTWARKTGYSQLDNY